MELQRLFDIPLYQLLHFPQKVALSMRSGIGIQNYSSQECLDEIMKVSAGALDKGLERGDRVAIMSKYNNPKWTFLDIGLQQIGIIPVPISPRYDDETLAFILKDAGVKLVLVDGRGLYSRLVELQKNIRSIKYIFTFENLPDVLGWDDFTAIPEPSHKEQYQASRAATHEDDLATIVYTADTSGRPKGVMLTHKNIVSNVKAILEALPLSASHTVVSFLPQHHIFERTAIYAYLVAACEIHYLRPSETWLEDIKAIRPHYFTGIPSTLQSIYKSLVNEVLEKPKAVQSQFLWATKLGSKYKDYGKLSLGYYTKLRVADLQVFKKWKSRLGGRIEGIILGSESAPPSLARLFTAAGIDIREGYGMTETSPVISINGFEYAKVNFGTAGRPLKGVEVHISDPKDEFGHGEIYVKGDNVMKGYWNDEKRTQEVLQEGWFRTGDVGRWTLKKSFLQIAGRKADAFYLKDGSIIHPHHIEMMISNSPFVEQCFVSGKGQSFLVALIVPFFPYLQLFTRQQNLNVDSKEEMTLHPRIQEVFRDEIQQMNHTLSPKEKIAKFHILQEEWTFQSGELSSASKKRRLVIAEKYKEVIAQLYKS